LFFNFHFWKMNSFNFYICYNSICCTFHTHTHRPQAAGRLAGELPLKTVSGVARPQGVKG
jgi:hypothetical protein